jgi:hypothetical protein
LDVNVGVGPTNDVLGFSTQTTNGFAGGIAGLHNICQTDFSNPAARVCTTDVVVRSPSIATLSPGAGWVQPVIVSSGLETTSLDPPNYLTWLVDVTGLTVRYLGNDLDLGLHATTLNCDQWKSDLFTRSGTVFNSSTGSLDNAGCQVEIHVLCCGPVP